MCTISSGDLVGRWFVTLKVYERSLSYVEGKPSDFTQSFYTALLNIRHSLLRILLTLGKDILVGTILSAAHTLD